MINALSYVAWALWLIVVGVVLLIRQSAVAPLARPAAGHENASQVFRNYP